MYLLNRYYNPPVFSCRSFLFPLPPTRVGPAPSWPPPRPVVRPRNRQGAVLGSHRCPGMQGALQRDGGTPRRKNQSYQHHICHHWLKNKIMIKQGTWIYSSLQVWCFFGTRNHHSCNNMICLVWENNHSFLFFLHPLSIEPLCKLWILFRYWWWWKIMTKTFTSIVESS